MELLTSFQSYLFSQTKSGSPATVKNYLSDISRFIRWYELYFSRDFEPKMVSANDIAVYQTFSTDKTKENGLGFAVMSPRSFNRHLASLRKFFTFLKETDRIRVDPFSYLVNVSEIKKEDVLNLSDFSNYLYEANISQRTIKNYVIDIQQFLLWATKVLGDTQTPITKNQLYQSLSGQLAEEYKTRLMHDAGFSPVSINRKLSSIRKFFAFLENQGYINQPRHYYFSNISNQNQDVITPVNLDILLSEQDKLDDTKDSAPIQAQNYSSVAPLRLLQKINNGILYLSEVTIIAALAALTERMQYVFWIMSGKRLFTQIAESAGAKISQTVLDTAVVKGLAQGLDQVAIKDTNLHVENVKKSFYAPLDLALDNLPWHKKVWLTVKHKRPEWYKRYHSQSIVHYIHFGVLFIYATGLVVMLSHTFGNNPYFQLGVLAAPPTDPPKTLSFSGRITDDQSLPITAPNPMRFSLYSNPVASGSALLWQEVITVKPDSEGKFITELGTKVAIPQELFIDNKQLYLGIARGQYSEMQPRQQIATTGLATDAQAVQGLRPITATNKSKNVLLALDSAGNLTIGGPAGTTFRTTEGQFALSGQAVLLSTNAGSDGNIILAADGLGIIDMQSALQNTGTANQLSIAAGSVEVDDTFAVYATSSAVAALTLQQDGTGLLISASASGIARFTLDTVGNGSFTGDLAVNGSSLLTEEQTFSLLPTNAVNLSIGANSTNISLGAVSGNTTVRNNLVINGNTTIGEATTSATLAVNARIDSHLIPAKNSTHNIGSNFQAWNNAYLTNLFMTPNATTSGFFKRDSGNVSFFNTNDSLLLGGNTASSALIKLAGSSGQDSFLNAGNLGIGTTTTLTDKLQVYGDVRVGTSTTDGCLKRFDGTAIAGTCSSDVRFKKNIAPIDHILTKVKQLRPVTYNMRSDEFPEYGFGNGLTYGLIAQEVEQLFPDLVQTDARGYKSVKYGPELTMLSLAAIKELALEVEDAQNRLSTFDNTNITDSGNIQIIADETHGAYAVIDVNGSIVKRIALFSKGFFAELSTGVFKAKEATLDTLAITTEKISIKGIPFQTYIEKTISRMLENKESAGSRTIATNTIQTNILSPLSDDSEISLSLENSKLEIRNTKSASGSAVASIDREGNASFSGSLTAQNVQTNDATISGTLRAGRIIADSIEGLDLSAEALAKVDAKLATLSGQIVTNITNVYTVASSSADPAVRITPSISPTPSPILADNQTQASSSALLAANTITSSFMDIASFSAAFAYTPHLNADFATVQNGLMVLGPTSLIEASIADQLAIGGNLILADTSINVLGATLEIQPLRQGAISFMGGLMALDIDGNLKVAGNATFAKDLTVKGKLATNLIAPIPGEDLVINLQTKSNNISGEDKSSEFKVKSSSESAVLSVNKLGDVIASGAGRFKHVAAESLNIVRGVSADTSAIDTIASGSAGVAAITAGYSSRTIYSDYVTEDSLIYITPRSETTTAVPYLARQTPADETYGIKGSFTVQIPVIQTEDILFNWWIIN